MHTIMIGYVMGSFQTFLFGNRKEDAHTSFDKINAAIKDWKRFKNDSSETVEISDCLGTAVIRIEHVASVTFTHMTAEAEAEQAEWAALNGRLAAVQKQAAKFAVLESELGRVAAPQLPQETASE